MTQNYNDRLNDWVQKEASAIDAIASIYKLWIERSVELLIFRRNLVNQGPVEILKTIEYGRQISKSDFSIKEIHAIVKGLVELSLCPSRIDVGRLATEWLASGSDDMNAFLKTQLADHLSEEACSFEHRDVVLYGFGRIGRLMARILVEQGGAGSALRLRAVVCRGKLNIAKRAGLLKRDSVHGPFSGTVIVGSYRRTSSVPKLLT